MSKYLSTFSISGKRDCADFLWDALVLGRHQLAPRYHLNNIWGSNETYPFMLFEGLGLFAIRILSILFIFLL